MKGVGLLRRAGWNLIDQVISSATNAVLSFLVARSVDDSTFGGFAVAFTVFSLTVGVSRQLCTSPLGIRFASSGRGAFAEATAAAVGAAAGLGLLAGVASVATSLAVGGAAGQALLALGVVLPALTVQDAWRHVFFAEGQPRRAAANDGLWAVVQLAAVGALIVLDLGMVGPLVLAWGGAAAAAALLGLRQSRVLPRPSQTVRWLRQHRNLTGYLILEFGTLQGCQQGALLVIAAVGSLEAIGALRGVQVLLGPTTILATAAFSFAVPEFSRRRAELSPRVWMLGAMGASSVVTLLGVCWGLVFVLLPDAVGLALLGETWAGTKEILWPTIISQAGAALALGPAIAIYAMDRAQITLALHSLLGPLLFIGGVGGVLLAGALGAAWGFAIAFWILVPLWFLRLGHEARRISAFDAAGRRG